MRCVLPIFSPTVTTIRFQPDGGANSERESYSNDDPGDDEIDDLTELGPAGFQGDSILD